MVRGAAVRKLLAVAAALTTAACVAAGSTPTRLTVSTYEVSGTTSRALDRQLGLHGPRLPNGERALAAAELSFRPTFQLGRSGGRCRLTNVEVALDANIVLPEWRQRATASEALGRNWDSFIAFAIRHELTHVEIAQRYARRAEVAMRRRTAVDCEDLVKLVGQDIARIMAEHDREQAAFDIAEQARIARMVRAAEAARSGRSG